MSLWSFKTTPALTEEQYERWQNLLEQRTGINFSQHKSILQSGLNQRMREIGIDDYDQYFQQVSAIPEGVGEWTKLVDRVSVKETSFFREPNAYAVLKNYLVDLISSEQKAQDYTLDIWSVGCSTGEEPYSLAIAATDIIDYLTAKIFLGVVATDISATALAVAKEGKYSARKIETLAPETKTKYFKPVANRYYQVSTELQRKLCFVQGNILELKDVPRLTMDVIFCQNVLVYFQRDRQKQVLDTLVHYLKPGGLLMVASGEASGWQHSQMKRTADESVQAYIKAQNS